MTRKLFLDDAYLREAPAVVTRADGLQVVLDASVFYAEKGGQGPDHGHLRWDAGEARVVDAQYEGDDIRLALDKDAPAAGTAVQTALDWPRRYGLMRNHTAAHVLCGVLYNTYRSLSTGGQLYPDQGRADFEFTEWKPEMKADIERLANEAVAKDLKVSHRTIPRAEFEAGDLVRTKAELIDPKLSDIRLTDIEGLDVQADGGTHVRALSEVGPLTLGKVDNKGKGIRRLTWTLAPQEAA